KKEYIAPIMEMADMDSAELICTSPLKTQGGPFSGDSGSNSGRGAISADSRGLDFDDDDNGSSIWNF
ncbi:MAG: hypothetical protein J6Y38_00790, partial [Bacteroidaceae bacterium]|nr:hypothetical protein [Bacteroidaceae bacterium]